MPRDNPLTISAERTGRTYTAFIPASMLANLPGHLKDHSLSKLCGMNSPRPTLRRLANCQLRASEPRKWIGVLVKEAPAAGKEAVTFGLAKKRLVLSLKPLWKARPAGLEKTAVASSALAVNAPASPEARAPSSNGRKILRGHGEKPGRKPQREPAE